MENSPNEKGESDDVGGQHIRHEINNILTGIVGHTQLLKLRGELTDKARERVDKIESLADRLQEIARQIKD